MPLSFIAEHSESLQFNDPNARTSVVSVADGNRESLEIKHVGFADAGGSPSKGGGESQVVAAGAGAVAEVEQQQQDDDEGDGVPTMVGIHLIYVIPFFLKLSSTIPVMYLAVALAEDFGASGLVQGIVIASFQLARAVVIAVNIYNPMISLVGGSIAGLLGFLCLAFYQQWEESSYALALFASANCAIGLSNGFSALQIFAKQEYSHDMGSLRFALRRQSVVGGVSCILSYFLSGEIYEQFGLQSIGYMGIIVMGSACLSIAMYLFGRRSRFGDEVAEEEQQQQRLSSKGDESSTFLTAEFSDQLRTSTASHSSDTGGITANTVCIPSGDIGSVKQIGYRPSTPANTSIYKQSSGKYGIGGGRNNRMSTLAYARQKSRLTTAYNTGTSTRKSTLDGIDSYGKLIAEKNRCATELRRKKSRPRMFRQSNHSNLDGVSNNTRATNRYSGELMIMAKSLGLVDVERPSSSGDHHLGSVNEMPTIGEDEVDESMQGFEKGEEESPSKTAAGGGVGTSSHKLGGLLHDALHGDTALNQQEELMNSYSKTEDVALNTIVFIIASAFVIEATTSGVISAIGALYVSEQFGKGTATTARAFGIASVFGTAFTFLILSDWGRVQTAKYVPSPRNMYVLMYIISISTILLIVPSFYVEVACIMFIIGFNEALWALLNEMEGAITSEKYYVSIGPGALFVHKLINMVVSLLAPILYQQAYWLPYVIAGSIAFVFTTFFVWRVERQRRQNAAIIAKVVQENCRGTAVDIKALRMSFTTLETLSRMASVCYKRQDVEAAEAERKRLEEEALKKKNSMFSRMSTAVGLTKVRRIMRESIAIE